MDKTYLIESGAYDTEDHWGGFHPHAVADTEKIAIAYIESLGYEINAQYKDEKIWEKFDYVHYQMRIKEIKKI